MKTLGFDIYGTLIDAHGLLPKLQALLGGQQGALVSVLWREKQLEYTFRRGLMGDYADFSVCTEQALNYALARFQLELTDAQKAELMAAYRYLPAFDEVSEALQALAEQGHRLYAFSNGSAEAIETLLHNAGVRKHFHGVVSVEAVRSFKPDPQVYQHFLDSADCEAQSAWLISSNPFDVIGARHAGLSAAWVQRQAQAVFDPWAQQPNVTVPDLLSLPAVFAEQ